MIKKKIIFIILISAICVALIGGLSIFLIFFNRGGGNGDILVEVYVNSTKTTTLTTNEELDYKITVPNNPTDITTDGTSKQYFLKWILDNGDPITSETKFTANSKIYAKFQEVNDDMFDCHVGEDGKIIIIGVRYSLGNCIIVPPYINSTPVVSIGRLQPREGDEKVIICEGIKEIRPNAFKDCFFLKNITLPSTLETIGENAFKDSFMENITIPKNVKNIGDYAFHTCMYLSSATFEEGIQITSIGKQIFYNCQNLKEIAIPSSVETIGEEAFFSCLKLTKATFADDSALISIGCQAFKECSALLDMQVPNNVTLIESRAFDYCEALKSLYLPSSLNLLCSGFFGCKSLQTITVGEGNPRYESVNNNLIDKMEKMLLRGCTENVPEGVKIIVDYAYWGCDAIKNVILPASVIEIGGNAFLDCKRLQIISIPNSVKKIDSFAFSGCSLLSTVHISTAMNTIQVGTFSGCSSLTSIFIPSNITTIQKVQGISSTPAFDNCTNLETVYIASSYVSSGLEANDSRGELCNNAKKVYIKEGLPIGPFIGENFTHIGEQEEISGIAYNLWRRLSEV